MKRRAFLQAAVVVGATGVGAAQEAAQGADGRGRGRRGSPDVQGQLTYHELRMYTCMLAVLLFSVIWFGMITFLRLKKRKSLVYLLFFTIFYVYLCKVLDYTVIQFQSMLLLEHFSPDFILNGPTAWESVNFIPLIALTSEEWRTSFLNILLLIPFGFGLPFITSFRMKKVIVAGALCSIGIELLQFLTGFMANMTFRVADINDVIFNTIGAAVGFVLFVGFARMYRHVFGEWRISTNPIFRHIPERPQVDRHDCPG